jgi:ABC-2 type transport system permease protein
VNTGVESASLELREIRGPSAFGGDLRRFWSLLWVTASTEFRLRYMHSVLGYVWTLLRPLLIFAILYVVFTHIIRFGDQVKDYPAFLLFNIMLYQLFADATGTAVGCVVRSENLVRKMEFPRIVIPLSVVLTSLITTLMNMIATLGMLVVIGVEPRATWLLIPLVLVAVLAFATGVALLLSAAYVRFRDLGHIWQVLSRALFYATPVLYPIELVPDSFREFVLANPLAPIFEQARIWVIDPSAPSVVDAAGGASGLLAPLVIFVGACAAGLWIFEREAPRVAEGI